MKTLLESIFGDRSSIIDQSNDSLWDGWDKAVQDFHTEIIDAIKEYGEMESIEDFVCFMWRPESNNNNILQMITGKSKITCCISFWSVRKHIKISMRIQGNSGHYTSDDIYIKCTNMNLDNIEDLVMIVINDFRNHPELYNEIKGEPQRQITMREFKKRYGK